MFGFNQELNSRFPTQEHCSHGLWKQRLNSANLWIQVANYHPADLSALFAKRLPVIYSWIGECLHTSNGSLRNQCNRRSVSTSYFHYILKRCYGNLPLECVICTLCPYYSATNTHCVLCVNAVYIPSIGHAHCIEFSGLMQCAASATLQEASLRTHLLGASFSISEYLCSPGLSLQYFDSIRLMLKKNRRLSGDVCSSCSLKVQLYECGQEVMRSDLCLLI